jgi:hypothetical protein
MDSRSRFVVSLGLSKVGCWSNDDYIPVSGNADTEAIAAFVGNGAVR